MRKIGLAMLSLLWISMAFAQIDTMMVISSDGLNLRSLPNKHGKIIDKLPFGSKVQLIDDKLEAYDSISIETHLQNIGPHLHGSWVKVKYGNKVGYVLDIFLFWEPNKSVQKDMILLFPGSRSCHSSNIVNPTDWVWTGYFKSHDSKLIAKTVEINYYREGYPEMLLINASITKDLLFITGTKPGKVLPKKPLKIIADNLELMYEDHPKYPDAVTLEKCGLQYIVHRKVYQDKESGLFILKDGKRIPMTSNSTDLNVPTVVEFVGDLDGDTKLDYIIQFGDKSSETRLYLSSQKNFEKPVAVFYGGYCC
jgi:hypothetical protein